MTALEVREQAGVLAQAQLLRVSDLATLDACRRWLSERRDGPLCVDTESGGLSPYHHRHRMTQIGDKRAGWAFGPGWQGAAMEMIRTYPWLAMFHSAYDNRVLKHHQGYEPRWAVTDDPMIAGRLVDSLKPAGLKPRAALDVDPAAMASEEVMQDAMRRQRWTYDTIPDDFPPYWRYGAMDTVLTAHMHDRFMPSITGPLRQCYDLERATARICAGMMDAGMMIDVPFITAKIAETRQFLAQVMPWLAREHGITSVNSNDQIGRALQRAGIELSVFTGTGQPGCDKDTLRMYRAMYPDAHWLIDAVLKARKGDSVIGKFLEKFLELRTADDVVHYSINTMRARTHRSSVTDPPMQTFDRDEPAVRGAFVPRPGHVFITWDMDQVEARLAAHFSGDRNMINEFRRCDAEGLSFFVEMASKIYGERVGKKDPRYTLTKNSCYAQVYGSGLSTAATTAGVPEEQMRPAYEGFRHLYPGVSRMMRRIINEARSMPRPGVRTMMGRTLYTNRGKEYSLQDYLVQGSAAEILKLSMIRLDSAGYGHMLRLPIHDEIIAECEETVAESVLQDVTQVLADRDSFSIPITWSGTILRDRWRKT